MALLVGSRAPQFTLPGWFGDSQAWFDLGAQRGHPVLLAFYPGDERLVCTRQLCAYSDRIADLHLLEAVVWAIAPQDIDSHRSFAQGRKLRMPLLADTDNVVGRGYGIVGAMGLRRSVFVVDADGSIAWRWVAAVNVVFPGVDELRKVLGRVRAAA